tara:strand:- start:98 stop:793 length:696 start_codon:yes stop_codon:yes gene_type:complete
MSNTLSVIVPCFNEEKDIEESLNRLLKEQWINEIIVVDDCSTDQTLNIVKNLKTFNPKIKIIESEKNQGKGAAIAKSKSHITSEFVVIHDADLEYYPKDLKNMYEKIQELENGFLLGSRFLKKNKLLYKRTYLANKFLSKLFSLVYGTKVTDVATCYKMMSAKFFNQLSFKKKGFDIEIEIVATYLNQYSNYFETPISYSARTYEEGKKIKILDGFKYIVSILEFRKNKQI